MSCSTTNIRPKRVVYINYILERFYVKNELLNNCIKCASFFPVPCGQLVRMDQQSSAPDFLTGVTLMFPACLGACLHARRPLIPTALSSSWLCSVSSTFKLPASCANPWVWRWRRWFSRTPQTWGRRWEPSGAAWPPGLYTNRGPHTSCRKARICFKQPPSVEYTDLLSVRVQKPTHLILSVSREKMLERLPIKPPLPPLYWPNCWETIKQVSLCSFQGYEYPSP